jgi:tRNA(Glu) U13 pseudouridine synthase TruD
MEYDLNENTFFVKELFSPKLIKLGYYNYYILEKAGLSHKQILKRIPKDSLFCGIKDKNATTTQWFCTKQDIEEINEENLKITYKGQSNEKIWIGKHKENSFSVLIKLNSSENDKLFKLKRELVGNYFGEQRFDARVEKFYELQQKGEYEAALKYFLTAKSKFDSENSTKIKQLIKEKWGAWKEISRSEIIPEAKKELFHFLEKKENYKEAFLFVEKKSLKQMLKAIQAKRFNDTLEQLMIEKNCKGLRATKALPRKIIITPTEFEKTFGLRKMERKTFFKAKKFRLKTTNKEDEYWTHFALPTGCYATIYLKFLKESLL